MFTIPSHGWLMALLEPQKHMIRIRVSRNEATLKWLVEGKSHLEMDDLGVPPFQETSICRWNAHGHADITWYYMVKSECSEVCKWGPRLISRRLWGWLTRWKGVPGTENSYFSVDPLEDEFSREPRWWRLLGNSIVLFPVLLCFTKYINKSINR